MVLNFKIFYFIVFLIFACFFLPCCHSLLSKQGPTNEMPSLTHGRSPAFRLIDSKLVLSATRVAYVCQDWFYT